MCPSRPTHLQSTRASMTDQGRAWHECRQRCCLIPLPLLSRLLPLPPHPPAPVPMMPVQPRGSVSMRCVGATRLCRQYRNSHLRALLPIWQGPATSWWPRRLQTRRSCWVWNRAWARRPTNHRQGARSRGGGVPARRWLGRPRPSATSSSSRLFPSRHGRWALPPKSAGASGLWTTGGTSGWFTRPRAVARVYRSRRLLWLSPYSRPRGRCRRFARRKRHPRSSQLLTAILGLPAPDPGRPQRRNHPTASS